MNQPILRFLNAKNYKNLHLEPSVVLDKLIDSTIVERESNLD
jgi:hypothetical protein